MTDGGRRGYGGRDPFAEAAMVAWRDDPPPAAAASGLADASAGDNSDDDDDETLPADVATGLETGGLWDDPEVIAAAGGATHLLDVLEGMGALFHAHHSEILAWPYKMFCAKWRRLIVQSAQRRWDEDTREEERQRRETQRALEEAHHKQWG